MAPRQLQMPSRSIILSWLVHFFNINSIDDSFLRYKNRKPVAANTTNCILFPLFECHFLWEENSKAITWSHLFPTKAIFSSSVQQLPYLSSAGLQDNPPNRLQNSQGSLSNEYLTIWWATTKLYARFVNYNTSDSLRSQTLSITCQPIFTNSLVAIYVNDEFFQKTRLEPCLQRPLITVSYEEGNLGNHTFPSQKFTILASGIFYWFLASETTGIWLI